MAGFIRNPKDFGAGILYIAFGAVGYFIALDYGFGQASRMGPGYFPSVLSALLMVFGLMAVIRSFIKPGEPLGGFAWKAAAVRRRVQRGVRPAADSRGPDRRACSR